MDRFILRTFTLLIVLFLTVSLQDSNETRADTQPVGPGDIVISQIYSGGGQPGSTYKYNYIELFNRSNRNASINGWPFAFASATGDFNLQVGFVSSGGIGIGAGQYLLIRMGPDNGSGAPLPVTPDFTLSENIQLSGKVAFSRPSVFISSPCPLPNSNIIDFVGFGAAANCFEGAAPVANLSSTTAAVRLNGGCTDTDGNANDFVVGAPIPRNSSSVRNFCSSAPPEIQLVQSNFFDMENSHSIGLFVVRTGNTSAASTVDYATSDAAGANNCGVVNGNASSRCDYVTAIGTLHFAPGEEFKPVIIHLVDDSYPEGTEQLSVTLSNQTGSTLGAITTATVNVVDNDSTATGVNPIDQTDAFVREQYVDFLNREPDGSGGGFWTFQINSCTPKPECTEIKRINVSAAFFLSIEFQESGYLVHRAYKTAFGDASGTAVVNGVSMQIPVPIIRLNEFLADSHIIGEGVVVGESNWQQQLEINKAAFFEIFVARQRFLNDYPSSLTPAEFVDKLNLRAGTVLTTSERDTLVNQLLTGQKSRAQVVRTVAEDGTLVTNESNRAFVLMQYFGYLRRNPNDPFDFDYSGFKFWLDKLNQFNGNFVEAEMVKAFINSSEYRQRFGP
ncbi:MAG TPA: Calx-beta domain-containing protein [Pyrinomonadaceae bacterium]|jgi:hypothetical protein|nr:Calx-beta domain-containing protein [Pyrinomonadaceae bacterium]